MSGSSDGNWTSIRLHNNSLLLSYVAYFFRPGNLNVKIGEQLSHFGNRRKVPLENKVHIVPVCNEMLRVEIRSFVVEKKTKVMRDDLTSTGIVDYVFHDMVLTVHRRAWEGRHCDTESQSRSASGTIAPETAPISDNVCDNPALSSL